MKNKSKTSLLSVVFGGLLIGLLIGGGFYYAFVIKAQNQIIDSIKNQYESTLTNTENENTSLLGQKNSLEEKVNKLQNALDNFNLEGNIEVCTSNYPESLTMDDIKLTLQTIKFDDETINAFLTNEKLIDLMKNGAQYYQICKFSPKEIAFVLYGTFGENNNVIGYLKPDYDEYPNNKFILTHTETFNPDSGDIGMCHIHGYIHGQYGHLVYTCGGGDGPGGNWDIYSLNVNSGYNKLLESCKSIFEETTCETDILDE